MTGASVKVFNYRVACCPILFMALLMPGLAAAQQVQRCVQADGTVAFTQGACQGESVESITIDAAPVHPDPQRSIPAYTLPPRQEQPRSSSRVTVVGPDAQCERSMSDQEIRTVIVRNSFVVGMTTDEIRRSLGPPLRINRSHRGNDQWVYPGRYLYIDKAGCLVSWN